MVQMPAISDIEPPHGSKKKPIAFVHMLLCLIMTTPLQGAKWKFREIIVDDHLLTFAAADFAGGGNRE